MADLAELVDLLDLAVADAAGVSPPADRRAAATIAASQRRRRDYLGASIAVAIAGGTGSGKSSLLNALAGEEISSTSAIRPHTDEPMAWAPAGDATMRALLESLGIYEIADNASLPSMALVDLPDIDSVVDDHRAMVEELLPHVDAVIWVFDPVKYNDPVMHDEFLAPLVGYQQQFIFVLNKADLLEKADRENVNALELVTDDLVVALTNDGFADPDLFVVAADPSTGSSVGIDELREALDERLASKHAASAKIVEDIAAAARLLGEEAGLHQGAGSGHAERISRTANNEAWLESTLEELALGGPTTERIAIDPGDRHLVVAALTDRARLAAVLAEIAVGCAELSAQLEAGRS
jgi:GTP-binding protein EngB required for normal cell division